MDYINLLNIVSKYYSIEENIYLYELLKTCEFEDSFFINIKAMVNNLANEIRKNITLDTVDNILGEYNLSNKEGVQMMCLAESLLRIPDFLSSDSFIKDKLTFENWNYYYGSDYWKIIFYNMVIDFISKVYYNDKERSKKKKMIILKKTIIFFSNLVMKDIGKKFVYSNNIEDAIVKASNDKSLYSFDMLGEASLTFYDSKKFYNQYMLSIEKINSVYIKSLNFKKRPSISIKLSALNPKFFFTNRISIYRDLIPLLKSLISSAINASTSITIDAEECDRMELTLGIFSNLFYSKLCEKWSLLGIVIQAYSKRALPTLYWLNKISVDKKKQIFVRLVKGAYWDYEIKFSQLLNLKIYPVYINKFCTDLSYLLCVIYLLSKSCKNNLFPQFATHNIQTISFILVFANGKELEFQKLYGMGNDVYNVLKNMHGVNIREYAPIGKYTELLPYLVRRLLENGANSSFVNKIINKNISLNELNKNPIFNLTNEKYNNKIPLPLDIFGGKRQISSFYNLNVSYHNYLLFKKLNLFAKKKWIAKSSFKYQEYIKAVVQPSNKYNVIGFSKFDHNISYSIKVLKKSFNYWKNININFKIHIVDNFLKLLKHNFIELIILCCKEAGKTVIDSISDIKEAIDFCHYYKNQAILIISKTNLPSITGENNLYIVEGKGIIAAISPWNFPIAIFCGQLIAALLTGNVVLSKPAESTSLIAYKIIQLLYKSGLPVSVCQLIIGSGSIIGDQISTNNNIYGIIFTGSNSIANRINKNLTMRVNRPIHKLIAETGGLNVMIADSTALIEQLVFDVVESSFKSCGQRCSALRLLYLNEHIYLETIKLLMSTVKNIKLGYPLDTSTDIGPVINKISLNNLNNYVKKYNKNDVFNNNIYKKNNIGYYIYPTIIRVNGIKDLKTEQFGPILHVAVYKNEQINNLIKDINNSEYGLTFGIHSRNETLYKYVSNKLNIGNIYINRNTIGAVVGMQPFGGNNLSGTGPKAGGCNYLQSLVNEKTITINSTAQGGNVCLLNE